MKSMKLCTLWHNTAQVVRMFRYCFSSSILLFSGSVSCNHQEIQNYPEWRNSMED